MKKVIQRTKDGEFIAEFRNGTEAAQLTGVNQSSIHAVCRRDKLKHAGGYKWDYVDYKVEAFHEDGSIYETYDNANHAAEMLGTNINNIYKIIKQGYIIRKKGKKINGVRLRYK